MDPLPDLGHVDRAESPRVSDHEADQKFLDQVEYMVNTDSVDHEDMILKSKKYEKRLEEESNKNKKTPSNPPSTPASVPGYMRGTTSSPGPTVSSPKSTASKGKGKAGVSRQAAMTLSMFDSQAIAQRPIKPLEPVPETSTELPEVPEEKKEDVGEEKPIEPTELAQAPSASEATEPTTSPFNAKGGAPDLGSDNFPLVSTPHPSEEFKKFSVASSQYETTVSEVSQLATQVAILTNRIREQNVSIGKLQEAQSQSDKDKSAFMSGVLDRIRHLERQTPFDPPVTTPASSAVVEKAEVATTAPQAPTREQLAAMRAEYQRKKALQDMTR